MTNVTVQLSNSNITPGVLNQNFRIDSVIDSQTYTVIMPVPANSSSTGNGGLGVTLSYEINAGLDTQVGGYGWGAGTWGRNGWNTPADTATEVDIRVWNMDTFGEDLVATVQNGNIYYWNARTGKNSPAVALADLSEDTTTPTKALKTIVSDKDRHLIAFAPNSGGVTEQNKMLIRFSSQEDPYDWTSTATNTAGDLLLGVGSQIVEAIETKREILVWTDSAMYSMQFVGAPYTYGVNLIASNINMMGTNTAAAVDDIVVWMGNKEFFYYAGQTKELICPVKNYIFDDFNYAQKQKVTVGVNIQYTEVTWFYPSATATEIDSYVSYNYAAQAWTYGTMDRSAWLDAGIKRYPIAANPTDNYLYYHEYGTDDGTTNPVSPLNAYIESAPIDLGEGDKFMLIRRVIPDITFINSTNSPQATLTLKTQNFPGSNYSESVVGSVSRVASAPVEQFTEQVYMRLRGRQVIMRVESDRVGTRWTLGYPRIDITPDGKR